MGTIVRNWITNKLGLEIPQDSAPATFRYEVANGILIAEILRKYGLLSDDEFVSLRHDNTSRTRTENMRHVHHWLTNAGMNFNEALMQDVAKEKSGCAIKFLYELFLWLENGPRKPAVGDNAKKYLSDPHRTSVKSLSEVKEHHRKSREERMSALSSTWVHSLQGQEEEPLDDETESVQVQDTKFLQTAKKERKWFTTLDPLENFQPGRSDPFNELSEVAQAEAVYFAEAAIDIFKDQEELKNEIRAIQRRTLASFASVQNEGNEIRAAVAVTKCEIVPDRRSQAKEEEKAYIEQEIRSFDAKLERNRKKGLDGQYSAAKSEVIYRNGRGCKEHFQASLEQLKRRRQKEVNAGIERSKWRKAAISKIIHEIPGSMFTSMQNDALKLVCTSLSTSEQRLAEFIHFGHQEKSLFKEHAYYDAIQRQNARNIDLEKASRIEEEQKKLKRQVLAFKYEDREGGARQLQEDLRLPESEGFLEIEEIVLAEDILDNVLDLVDRLAFYRDVYGSALFDAQLFDEGEEEFPDIVLRLDQKFVLDIGHGFEDEGEGGGEGEGEGEAESKDDDGDRIDRQNL